MVGSGWGLESVEAEAGAGMTSKATENNYSQANIDKRKL